MTMSNTTNIDRAAIAAGAHDQHPSACNGHRRSADIRDAKRRENTICKSEGDGTRTRNLRIDSPVLENANVDTNSTFNNANSNTSSRHSSRNEKQTEITPQLEMIQKALAILPGVERDAVAQHIHALAKMSKKRRHAILTLTEEEV